MNILLYHIKGLFTVLNIILFISLIAFLAARFRKKRLSKSLTIIAIALFLLCSTAYLPQFLARRLEKEYLPFNPILIKAKPGKIYIHLLGSGYALDKRLPATAQLAIVAQCRLVEAIRVFRQLDSSVLVCSAGSLLQKETQAAIVRKAAILLGVDSTRIITLDTPSTTMEEAAALAERVGAKANIIIVTDALHMPRAYKFFKQQGFNPIAAPTNYRVLESENDLGLKWWPTTGSISLMDMVLHEYLGTLKGAL